MAKKSKKIEPTTQSDRVKVDDEILSKLSKEKVMKIPDNEVVLLPISGGFKRHIDDVMYYIMDEMEASEIITAFQMIKINFKGVDPDLIDMRVKALWTLMSITTELNYQAAEQGKWQETDTVIGDALNKISQTNQEEATLAEYKKDRDALKKSNKDRLQRLEDKIKEANKKKKSNEDSPQ